MATISTIQVEPVPEVVELLEKWLKSARHGDIRAIAMVALRDNLRVRCGWSGLQSVPQEMTIIGAIETLKFDIQSESQKEYPSD